jgi:hypothetical protein
MKEKSAKSTGAPRYRYRSASRRSGGAVASVVLYLPPAHLTMLDQEATALMMSRSRFLEMLLRRKLGEVSIERGKNLPSYKFKEKDFEQEQHQRFTWVMSPEMKKRLEEDLLLLGQIGIQAWVIRYLLEWIGKLNGFSRDKDGNMV